MFSVIEFLPDVKPGWYLVTTAEAAKLAHVRPATIRVWAHRGHIRPVGPERGARWDIREVIEYAARSRSA